MPSAQADLVADLEGTLADKIKDWTRKARGHQWTYDFVAVTSVVLSIGITIAGLFAMSNLAAIFGAVLTALIVLQQVFPFRDMAYHYRCGIAEAEGLELDLQRADNLAEKESVSKRLRKLNLHIAKDLPRGQTLQATLATGKSDATTETAESDPEE